MSWWMVTYQVGLPPADGIPNWDRRRATTLIETNVLPLSQTATKS